MPRLCLVFLVISVPALVVRAFGAADQPLRPEIEREVARLSSDRWTDRRDAVGRLVRMGPSAELQLRRLLAQPPSPEVRLRAEAALRLISGMRRTHAALVTLDLRGVKASDAFEQLAEIEGSQLPTDPPDLLDHVSGTLHEHCEQQPYWQVVLELCRRTGLKLKFGDKGVVLARTDSRPENALGCSGPFLLRAQLVPWSVQPTERGRSLRLEVYGEPRTELLRGEWKVELENATDQRGNSLLPLVESGINLAGAQDRVNGAAWTVPLRPADGSDVMLKTCKGKVKVVLAQGEQTIELPGPSADRSLAGGLPLAISSGSMTASVLRVVQTEKDYEMDVQLAVDPSHLDFDALFASMQSGRFRTFDANGRELALKNLWRDGGGPMNNIRCRWGTKAGQATSGAPFKLLWQVPTRTTVVTVPFELSDVRTQ